MKIAILASNPEQFENKRFVEEAEKRGHQAKIINLSECFVKISSKDPQIHYRGGESIESFDAVIPRIEALTFFGTAVLRQFELFGAFPLNSSDAVLKARDKLKSLQILSKHLIPMPTTGFANSPQDTNDIITSVGGAPLIIKLVEGTEGVGVVLAETKSAASSVIAAFKQLNANILVQEFIKESRGTDIRCFVVGNKVIASMQRTAKDGEFRANFHLGADVKSIKITPEERAMAVKASKALGLNVSGVDLLRSNNGPLILEVNASPGLKGIERATSMNIAEIIIEHLEKNVKIKA